MFFNHQAADVQRAKLWVVERRMAVLLSRSPAPTPLHEERPDHFLTLQVHDSPAVRATQSAVGDTVKAMLDSCEPCDDVEMPAFQLLTKAGRNRRGRQQWQGRAVDSAGSP